MVGSKGYGEEYEMGNLTFNITTFGKDIEGGRKGPRDIWEKSSLRKDGWEKISIYWQLYTPPNLL